MKFTPGSWGELKYISDMTLAEHKHLETTRVDSTTLLRFAHGLLPVEKRFYPLISHWEKYTGLLSVPWSKSRFEFPVSWLKICGETIYKSPKTLNPEFFRILAPELKNLSPGSIVDVGANMGVYVLNFRSLSSAPIIAYEPAPFVFTLLSHNVWANGLKNVTLKNLACGDKTGQLGIALGINSSIATEARKSEVFLSESWETTAKAYEINEVFATVNVVKLDDDLRSAGPISLLKIDCEGFEYHVLSGAIKLLELHKPLLFVELHPQLISNYGHSLDEVCHLLRSGYDLEFWDFSKAQRSTNAFVRLTGRYFHGGEMLKTEAAMLDRAKTRPIPAQLFMLARPKSIAR
jgi:FkbM family methyltransferase